MHPSYILVMGLNYNIGVLLECMHVCKYVLSKQLSVWNVYWDINKLLSRVYIIVIHGYRGI